MKSIAGIIVAWLGISTALVAPVRAQEIQTPVSASDPTLAIVPTRSIEQIDGDLELAAELGRAFEQRRLFADVELTRSEQAIVRTKQQLDAVKQQLKQAKQDGRDADKVVLGTEQKSLEQLQTFYGRERDLRKAEIQLADARVASAAAARTSLDLERQLIEKRAEVVAAGMDALRRSQVLSQLEKTTLEAQKKRSELDRRAVDREKSVIAKRLKLFDARAKLTGS